MHDIEKPFLPAIQTTGDGTPRRCGLELEFIGLELAETARIVETVVNGKTKKVSDYEYEIIDDSGALWKIERDYALLKEFGRRKRQEVTQPLLENVAESALKLGSSVVVPVEVIGPPLPMNGMPIFNSVAEALHKAGARGTDESLVYAFGLQFNPELPELAAAVITRYLQAFLCLQDWLFKNASMDSLRRLTGYAAPFSSDYAIKVIQPDYQPEMAQLIDDYLKFNPTRNRALDCLPLFLHIDKYRVRAKVPDPRVKARPTFHYRLPNSNIGDPNWSIFTAWTDWLEVEWLAGDDTALKELSERYTRFLETPFSSLNANWDKDTAAWLAKNHSSP